MPRNDRTYEDYEELGRRLIAFSEAMGELSSLLFRMFESHDDRGRPVPSGYDSELLRRHLDLERLVSQLASEYRAEAPDVPEGKPAAPPPFDKEGA